jgi:hypothetical protein
MAIVVVVRCECNNTNEFRCYVAFTSPPPLERQNPATVVDCTGRTSRVAFTTYSPRIPTNFLQQAFSAFLYLVSLL